MSLITAGTDTGKSCAIARWRRGGAGGGGACEGETSGVGGVRVPEGSSQGSSTRSSCNYLNKFYNVYNSN